MLSKYTFEKKAIEAYQLKDYEKAVYWYSRAISVRSDDAELYSERAVAFYHRSMLEDALNDMNRAQELQPEKPYRYSSRAYIREAMDDTEGAIEDYKIAVKLDPDDAVAHNNLGLLEEKRGHAAQAKALYKLADALAENEPQADPSEMTEPKNIQREIEQERATKSVGTEMLNVFTSREGFKEFLSFIRNGFR